MFTIVKDNNNWFLESFEKTQNLIKEKGNSTDIIGYFYSELNRGKFTLFDTPGIDSALNPEHKKITESVLHKIETIVYVIPVETYGSDDDDKYLKYIKNKVSYSRIVFVVNMIDTIDKEDDSVEEILNNIKKYLSEKVGYNNPIVYPISAEAGLLLKQMLSGKQLSKKSDKARNFIKRFLKPEYALGKYSSEINNSIMKKEKIFGDWLCYPLDEQTYKAFINTGLPGLEKLLLETHNKEKKL